MIAVSGANGYVGGLIAAALATQGVVRLVRRPMGPQDMAWSFASPPQALAEDLRARGITQVIHAAWDMKANRLDELEAGCVAGSLQLLAAARAAGAQFIFISSISAFAGARSAYGRAKLQVEAAVLEAGGIVLRLGLVVGAGGMLGALRQTVSKAKLIPLIGSGNAPQYLLPEASLAQAVHMAIEGKLAAASGPVTLAHPKPVPFKSILRRLAAEAGREIVLIPVPWPFLYAALRAAEACGLKLGFRSDSIVSFIYQDPAPDFAAQGKAGLAPPGW